jgi:hypothetical protein
MTFLAAATATTPFWAVTETISITGGAGIDSITGDAGLDTIDGGSEGDQIDGGLGNDVLYGAAGDDNILGGGGDDLIYGDVQAPQVSPLSETTGWTYSPAGAYFTRPPTAASPRIGFGRMARTRPRDCDHPADRDDLDGRHKL